MNPAQRQRSHRIGSQRPVLGLHQMLPKQPFGNIAELNDQHVPAIKRHLVRRPNLNWHRLRIPVSSQDMKPRVYSRLAREFADLVSYPLTLVFGMEPGKIRPNQILARTSHQCFKCRVHVHQESGTNIKHQFGILGMGPAQFV